MGKATVIFADGSKQMAHNLDDSRFRWHERRIAQSQDAYDLMASNQIVVRYGEPESIPQAQQYIAELKAQSATIRKIDAFVRDEYTDDARRMMRATYIAAQEIERVMLGGV